MPLLVNAEGIKILPIFWQGPVSYSVGLSVCTDIGRAWKAFQELHTSYSDMINHPIHDHWSIESLSLQLRGFFWLLCFLHHVQEWRKHSSVPSAQHIAHQSVVRRAFSPESRSETTLLAYWFNKNSQQDSLPEAQSQFVLQYCQKAESFIYLCFVLAVSDTLTI